MRILQISVIASLIIIGLLIAPNIYVKIQTTVKNKDINSTYTSDQVSSKIESGGLILSNTTYPVNTPKPAEPDQSEDENAFEVKTDYGYYCSSGNSQLAIEKAIESLPSERSQPAKIYLSGTFTDALNITLQSNIEIIGKNAVIISNEPNGSIFKTNNTATSTEAHNSFYIGDTQYTDWISIHNVTFNNIHFKHVDGIGLYAIFAVNYNSTGWEVTDQLNILNCEFEGYYRAVCINAQHSVYANNSFHNNDHSGLFFPYGYNITVTNNTFATTDGDNPEDPSIGLVLLDVMGTNNIYGNTFNQTPKGTGIGILSCVGETSVYENQFINGTACKIDYQSRPFLSEGIVFRDNIGVEAFAYDIGSYTDIIPSKV